ncbi:hypothetical protein DL95DRAFT_87516 [Leptodontidium sp. 2 PMI_412]|nr:hypothetical protein DL95DRAFT_87516 [Leptodontidium sp. 2 PMI_412]
MFAILLEILLARILVILTKPNKLNEHSFRFQQRLETHLFIIPRPQRPRRISRLQVLRRLRFLPEFKFDLSSHQQYLITSPFAGFLVGRNGLNSQNLYPSIHPQYEYAAINAIDAATLKSSIRPDVSSPAAMK